MLSENSIKEWKRRIDMGVSLCWAPRCVLEDKTLVLLAVAKDGSNLEFVSDDLKKDIDVVSVAITHNLEYLKYVDKDLQALIILKGIEAIREEKKVPDLTPLLESIICGEDDLESVEIDEALDKKHVKKINL